MMVWIGLGDRCLDGRAQRLRGGGRLAVHHQHAVVADLHHGIAGRADQHVHALLHVQRGGSPAPAASDSRATRGGRDRRLPATETESRRDQARSRGYGPRVIGPSGFRQPAKPTQLQKRSQRSFGLNDWIFERYSG